MKNLRIELSQAFTILLIILLIGVSIFAGILYRRGNHSQEQQKANPATFEQPNEKLKDFVSKDSVKHALFTAREAYKEDLKNGNGISPTYVDSLARALDKSKTDFTEVAIINATVEGRIKALIVLTDSLRQRTFYFKQKYLAAEFSEKDSILKYKYDAQIGYAKFEEKSGFLGLGAKKKQIDIFSKDPDMTINSVKQLSIKESVRRKPFGFGIMAGYFWNPSSGKVEKGFGVGVSYSLVRF